MKKLILLFGIISTSCSYVYDLENQCDSELQPYLDSFLAEAKERGIEFDNNYSIHLMTNIEDYTVFSNPHKNAAAHTEYFDGKRKNFRIFVKYDFYEKNIIYGKDSLRFEKTMFHEFGHGFLGRDHEDKNSIMVGGSLPEYTKQTRKEYLDELFYN